MIQIRIDKAFRDSEGFQAVDKIFLPVPWNNDLIQGGFIADVFQSSSGIVYGKPGLLGVHPKVVFNRVTGQNFVPEGRIVVGMFEGWQQHFLTGVCINGKNTVPKALLLI